MDKTCVVVSLKSSDVIKYDTSEIVYSTFQQRSIADAVFVWNKHIRKQVSKIFNS